MNRRDPDEDFLVALGARARAERAREEEGADGSSFRELDPAEQRALSAGVLARLGVPAPRGAEKPRRVTRAVLGVSLAAAAALALVFWPRSAALPRYTLVAPEGDGVVRAEHAERAAVYSLGRELTLLFRPKATAPVTPDVACYARQAGRTTRLTLQSERSDAGAVAVRLRTGPGTALEKPGAYELLCLVYEQGAHAPDGLRPEAPPRDAQSLTLALTLVAK